MHQAAHSFVAEVVDDIGPPASVIEIGSRDINGSIRELFQGADPYIGLDMVPGPKVDWVGDARFYVPPTGRVECVVCCEVLEHSPYWQDLILTAASWLNPGGHLIVTCAGPGRAPHSGFDGKHRLTDGEHYCNVGADDLWKALEGACAGGVLICREVGEDTQALAVA